MRVMLVFAILVALFVSACSNPTPTVTVTETSTPTIMPSDTKELEPTIIPTTESTITIEPTTQDRINLQPREAVFDSERAYNQVTYYFQQLGRASVRAKEYCWEYLSNGELTVNFYIDKANADVNGHKHTGWEVHYRLLYSPVSGATYPKDYWDNSVWAICKDGYVYESSENARHVIDDILNMSDLASPSYYLFPAPYFLIFSADDEVGDCKSGHIDIIKFDTWRENSLYTFVLYLRDNIEKNRTSYQILIDCDHSDLEVARGVDYIVALDYYNDQIGLLEADLGGDEFIKIRDFTALSTENNVIKMTIDLQGIVFTWPGFQACTAQYSEIGKELTTDWSNEWWYK